VRGERETERKRKRKRQRGKDREIGVRKLESETDTERKGKRKRVVWKIFSNHLELLIISCAVPILKSGHICGMKQRKTYK